MLRLFDPDPTLRWLFCLTHPDDEISICCWIKRLMDAGNYVAMSWTHHNPVRRSEARAAAHLIGVPAERLFFHPGTDGRVCHEMHALEPGFRTMLSETRPDRICCGAFEQGHLDHDATNFVISRVAACPVLEIPFYHTYRTRLQTLNRFSDPRGESVIQLEPNERQFKQLIARQYPSQNIWQVLVWYELSQTVRLRKMTLARTERMRLLTRVNYAQPNHPPKLAASVADTRQWRVWLGALEQYATEAGCEPFFPMSGWAEGTRQRTPKVRGRPSRGS